MALPAVVITENALPRRVRITWITLGMRPLAHIRIVPSLLLAAWKFAFAHQIKSNSSRSTGGFVRDGAPFGGSHVYDKAALKLYPPSVQNSLGSSMKPHNSRAELNTPMAPDLSGRSMMMSSEYRRDSASCTSGFVVGSRSFIRFHHLNPSSSFARMKPPVLDLAVSVSEKPSVGWAVGEAPFDGSHHSPTIASVSSASFFAIRFASIFNNRRRFASSRSRIRAPASFAKSSHDLPLMS